MSENARTLPCGAVIDDRRTPEDKTRTCWLVVATDKCMSGWGFAPGRSLFAVPCETYKQAEVAMDNMAHRSEMKRARIVRASTYRPRLAKGDHLSIRSFSDADGFHTPGYFAAQ